MYFEPGKDKDLLYVELGPANGVIDPQGLIGLIVVPELPQATPPNVFIPVSEGNFQVYNVQ